MSCFRLLNALYTKVFAEVVPDQAVHVSCSIERDTSAPFRVFALEGATTGIETLRAEAKPPNIGKHKIPRMVERESALAS